MTTLNGNHMPTVVSAVFMVERKEHRQHEIAQVIDTRQCWVRQVDTVAHPSSSDRVDSDGRYLGSTDHIALSFNEQSYLFSPVVALSLSLCLRSKLDFSVLSTHDTNCQTSAQEVKTAGL